MSVVKWKIRDRYNSSTSPPDKFSPPELNKEEINGANGLHASIDSFPLDFRNKVFYYEDFVFWLIISSEIMYWAIIQMQRNLRHLLFNLTRSTSLENYSICMKYACILCTRSSISNWKGRARKFELKFSIGWKWPECIFKYIKWKF